jgi:hypothetical protein
MAWQGFHSPLGKEMRSACDTLGIPCNFSVASVIIASVPSEPAEERQCTLHYVLHYSDEKGGTYQQSSDVVTGRRLPRSGASLRESERVVVVVVGSGSGGGSLLMNACVYGALSTSSSDG